MHIDDFKKLIDSITYKPWIKISLVETYLPYYDKKSRYEIQIKGNVTDSTDYPEFRKRNNISLTKDIPEEYIYNLNRAEAINIIIELIMENEQHEMEEFFRVDGELVFNPHGH